MESFNKRSISLKLADKLVKSAIEKAMELKINIAITIVDESANAVLFNRMDYTPLMAHDISRRKAITAAGFGIPTGKPWHDFIKDDPILDKAIPLVKDFSLLGGGAPIIIDDSVIGAIGVSGGHYTEDELCVKAALESI
ncbi:MAG: heme-binding protein [Bacteroidales bacterium]|nr:heme-binding protein [Bacteroidales bacterium]